MKVGDEVFFAHGGIKRGTVAKVLGDKLRVEFTDFVVIDVAMVMPVSQIEHTPIAITAAPVIGKKKKK